MPATSATQRAGIGSSVSVTATISHVAATTPTRVSSRTLFRRLAAAARESAGSRPAESSVAIPKARSGTTITAMTASHGRRSAASPPITTRISRMTTSTTTTAAAAAVTMAMAKTTIPPVTSS